MNKNLKQYLENKGMIVETASAYGIIEGYETNFVLDGFDNQNPIKMQISCYLSAYDKEKVVKEISDLRMKEVKVIGNRFGILLSFTVATMKKLIKVLEELLEKVFVILNDNGAFGSEYCPICASEFNDETKKLCSVNGLKISIDMDCVTEINHQIKSENEEFKNAPNNFVKGFVGALMGALVGAIIAIILYFLGFISAISGFVAVILGTYLYKKLGGKPNKIMAITVVATSFVVLILTTIFVYMYYAVALEYGGFASAMQNEVFKSSFVHDLLMTILFTGVGSVYEIINLFKSIKREKTL